MINKITFGPAYKIASHNFQAGDVLISFANSSSDHIEVSVEVPRFLVNCMSAQYPEEGEVFTEEMGRNLVDFLKSRAERDNTSVFINCDHGEMRSASCAKALKDFFNVPCFFIGNNTEVDPEVYCYRIYDSVLDALM